MTEEIMDKMDEVQAAKSETIVDAPLQDEQINAKLKATPRRKSIIIALFAVIVAIAIIAVPSYLNGTFFNRLASDVAKAHPGAHCYFGSDYFAIDSNPRDIDSDDMDLNDYLVSSNSIKAIEYVNNKLGFPTWVYQDMLDTTALMGRQNQTSGKYTVTWSYHPNKGLEVKYTKN